MSRPPVLSEQRFLVLLALAHGRRHGYGLIELVRELSSGEVVLGPGTLYGVLDRLVAAGLVTPAGEEIVDGRLRRYYAITDAGASAARGELARLESRATSARMALRACDVPADSAS